jgi:hypothetical protein
MKQGLWSGMVLVGLLVFLPVLGWAAEDDRGNTPEAKLEAPDWYLHVYAASAGELANGAPDVKPFSNARKFGFDRSNYDVRPDSWGVDFGKTLTQHLALELYVNAVNPQVYEYQTLAGGVLVDNTVTTYQQSVYVAPVVYWPKRIGFFGAERVAFLSLGCRLGWAWFNAHLESATPTSLVGKMDQNSNTFTYEPFARVDFAIGDIASVGLEASYLTKDFQTIWDSNGSGAFANAPITDKNPDGTDTSVDFGGMTAKFAVGLPF